MGDWHIGDITDCPSGRKARITAFASTGHVGATYIDGDCTQTILRVAMLRHPLEEPL